jgi:hypothetical protein
VRHELRGSFTLGLALAALVLVGATVAVAVPRWQRRRALDEALVQMQRCTPAREDFDQLAWFGDEPEAVLGIAGWLEVRDRWASAESHNARVALRHAVEVHAASAVHDDRIEEKLRAWLDRPGLALLGHYLLDEIAHPRYADTRGARTRQVARERSDSWLEQLDHTIEWERLVEVPAGELLDDRMDPLKALRAWAALSDCEVVDRGDVLEIVPVVHRP